MDLCVTSHNPAPAGSSVFALRTTDGVALRAALWRCGEACAGTVAIFPGRAEFIEKYFEVAGDLLARNFDVVILDWRGQGGAGRLTLHPGKGHVSHFAAYQRDLDALGRQVLEPHGRRPFFALGHSMAGPILLEQARAGRSPFERLVLTAPMIDLPRPPLVKAAYAVVPVLAALGFGRVFAPGCGGGAPYLAGPFEGNVLTADPERYARAASVVAAAPKIAIGAPTLGWASSAFRQMRRLADGEYPRRILTPVLLVAAGADAVVDTPAAEAFASRLKVGRCITLAGARHEILIERDSIRTQFWAAFDAFIPGSRPAADPVAARLAAAAARQDSP
jgi:lysophospholipase